MVNPGALILIVVAIKLIAPNREDRPERCKLKIAKSTAAPLCASIDERGGYIVHPVPAPCSTIADTNSSIKDGGRSQKLMLLSLGNAISGAPISTGSIQFPKPPKRIGITMKKIIKIA